MEADGSDPATATVVARLTEMARSLVAGRRIILAGFPVAGATPTVAQLQALGAESCLLVAPFVGTGDLPDPTFATWVSLDIRTPGTMEVFRIVERAMADPPEAVRDAVETFDPDGEALVLVAPYDTVRSVAGRPAFGARRPEWVALEDKTTNDTLFEQAGVVCAPSEVVVAGDRSALDAAAARLDAGAGTVWSGDARAGFNGGGTLVRWVTSPETAADAAGAPGGAVRPRARGAAARRHPLQHPRHRDDRRHRGLPPDRDGHAADRRPAGVPLRRRRLVLGPARGRPGRDARTSPAASARCSATRSRSPGPTASTACSPPTASAPPSSSPASAPG